MRQGAAAKGRQSTHSVSQSAAPSIPRREQAGVFAQSKQGFSQMVLKIEWGVTYLEKVRGNAVKTPQAELDLAEYFDTARVWMEQLMQRKDKTLLTSIFNLEGDAIDLLVHLEEKCQTVELRVSSDKRRLDLLQRIAACNEVLADLGYGQELRDAKLRKNAMVEEEGAEEDPVYEAVPPMAEAAFFGSQAMAFEQEFDFIAAAETYDKAAQSLRVAITVCQAVVKLKASIDAPESLLEEDLLQLQRLESQTNLRVEHLQNLEPGATPVPLAEQIQPVDLAIHQDFKITKKMVHAYAGLGVVAAAAVAPVLFLSGPFGLALLAGATVGTAVGITFTKNSQENLGGRDDSQREVDEGTPFFSFVLESMCCQPAKKRVGFPPMQPGTEVGSRVQDPRIVDELSPRSNPAA